MTMKKIAITIQDDALAQVDSLVKEGVFPNRSKVIQAAVDGKLLDLQKVQLFTECMKLNKTEEQALAEGVGGVS